MTPSRALALLRASWRCAAAHPAVLWRPVVFLAVAAISLVTAARRTGAL